MTDICIFWKAGFFEFVWKPRFVMLFYYCLFFWNWGLLVHVCTHATILAYNLKKSRNRCAPVLRFMYVSDSMVWKTFKLYCGNTVLRLWLLSWPVRSSLYEWPLMTTPKMPIRSDNCTDQIRIFCIAWATEPLIASGSSELGAISLMFTEPNAFSHALQLHWNHKLYGFPTMAIFWMLPLLQRSPIAKKHIGKSRPTMNCLVVQTGMQLICPTHRFGCLGMIEWAIVYKLLCFLHHVAFALMCSSSFFHNRFSIVGPLFYSNVLVVPLQQCPFTFMIII